MSRNLTKSLYTAFRQCPKYMWLQANKPEEATPDDSRTAHFVAGSQVGELAKALLGPFTDATVRTTDERLDIDAMISRTKQLINDPHTENICEAAFSVNGLYCAVDVLHRDGKGWAIYEVKSSTANDGEDAEEVQIWDISFQRYVLEQCGLTVTGTFLVRLNRDYVLDGPLDTKALFRIDDVCQQVTAELAKTEHYCQRAIPLLQSKDEPTLDLSNNCNAPFICPFRAYCMKQKGITAPSVFDLYRLQWKKKLAIYRTGHYAFSDLRSSTDILPHHRLQIACALDRTQHIDKKGIQAFLRKVHYPLYHLDFETFQPVIPIYQGTHPYQQIPFQYSLHIQPKQGAECEHRDFLAEPDSPNPMRELAEQLCRDIPADGCVLVYNDNFERTRLKEMAAAFPDLADHLLAIRDHIIDLLDPFRAWHYYIYTMGSSFSIKRVLPALFPDDPTLDYDNLKGEVHNGGQAMTLFPQMQAMSPAERSKARQDLLEYCALDTWSMVVILQRLYDAVQ